MLATGLIVAYGYFMEIFMALLAGTTFTSERSFIRAGLVRMRRDTGA